MTPAHTLTENLCWCEVSLVARGFCDSHLWRLCWLKIPSLVNLDSSVQRMVFRNSSLSTSACRRKRQNCKRRSWSPSTKPETKTNPFENMRWANCTAIIIVVEFDTPPNSHNDKNVTIHYSREFQQSPLSSKQVQTFVISSCLCKVRILNEQSGALIF